MRLYHVILLSLVVIGALPSCNEVKREHSPIEIKAESILRGIHENDLSIVKIDGCEYLIYEHSARSNQGFGFMSHKGNCSNPIHVYRPDAAQPVEGEDAAGQEE
jgi:hypothetical protein